MTAVRFGDRQVVRFTRKARTVDARANEYRLIARLAILCKSQGKRLVVSVTPRTGKTR